MRGFPAAGDIVTSRGDKLPEDPAVDRAVLVLLAVAAGAFALMLVWLLGR